MWYTNLLIREREKMDLLFELGFLNKDEYFELEKHYEKSKDLFIICNN